MAAAPAPVAPVISAAPPATAPRAPAPGTAPAPVRVAPPVAAAPAAQRPAPSPPTAQASAPPRLTTPAPAPPPALTTAAAVPAPAPPPRAEPRVINFEQLPEDVRRTIPPLAIGGAIYSDNAASRMLIVGGQLLKEGDSAAPGLTLEQIKPRSAVLRWKDLRYEMNF
jgi:general secretion pathway protein B